MIGSKRIYYEEGILKRGDWGCRVDRNHGAHAYIVCEDK